MPFDVKYSDELSMIEAPDPRPFSSLPGSVLYSPSYRLDKNVTFGPLSVGDYVWIHVYPTTPFFYYGVKWEKGEDYPLGIMENGEVLQIVKANGTWFYKFGDEYLSVSPCAYVSTELLTENGGVIDSHFALWDHSSGDVVESEDLGIRYTIDNQSPIGVRYILRFSGRSFLPFGTTIWIEVLSRPLLSQYAEPIMMLGLGTIVVGLFIRVFCTKNEHENSVKSSAH